MSTHTITATRSGSYNGMDWHHRVEMHSMPEPNSGCLLWFGPTDTHGYGQLRIKGRLRLVHRLIWEDAHGAISPTMCVCHRCDVRACIELGHLFLGTHAVNMTDMLAKGRNAVQAGESNGRARLAVEDVRAIRSDLRPRALIAEAYGVSRSTVDKIKQANLWRHVP